MRGVAELLVVTTLLSVLTGCQCQAPSSAAQAPTPLQSPDALAKVGWQYYWTMPRPSFLRSGETAAKLFMLGDNVAYLTSHNRLVAFEASTGRVRWSLEAAPVGEVVYDPCFVKGMVIHQDVPGLKTIVDPDAAPWAKPFDAVVVSTPSYLIVLDAQSGRVVRGQHNERFTDMPPATSGAADTKRFYGATAQGTCFAFDIDSGMRTWIFGGYSGVVAPVREFGGQVFMGNKAGQLYAAKADKDRTLMWEQSLREPVVAPFHVSKRGVFVGGERGSVYAFETIGGRQLWEQPYVCEGRLADGIQASTRSLFQYAQGDKFHAIGITDGKGRWTHKDGRTVLAILGDDVCVLDSRRVLHALDEITGKEKWATPLTGMDLFLPNTVADGIWAASRDGRIYCLRPVSAGRLTLEMLGISSN